MAQARRRLSPHFAAAEFDCRDGTRWFSTHRAGYEVLARQLLEPLRERFGPVTVLSGHRSIPYNRRVGGAAGSFHVNDLHPPGEVAADVKCQAGTPRQWHTFLIDRRHLARDGRGGLGLYVGAGFVHVDTRPYRADWVG